MTTILLNEISKNFGSKHVLEQQTLTFSSGQIYGIVGYNGCGKTVLLKCICQLMQTTTGKVQICMDEGEVPVPACGVVIDGASFIDSYSAFQNLEVLAQISGKIGKKEIEDVLRRVGLDPADKKKVKYYSLGMRQRLAIAQAIIEDPPVLLLDEPLNGLDCEGIQTVYKIICEEKKKGKAILVASHHEEDIRLLCDRVYWLNGGMLKEIENVEVYTQSKIDSIRKD